ncbi:MAG: SHOCT domain-containing protein [Thermoleophilia bacterium]|nr:SHOCT domain-containing protein [Thermoleophilia bacterium]
MGRQAGHGATPPDGVAAEVERLAALHASGALTDDEFAAAKAALIMPPPQG